MNYVQNDLFSDGQNWTLNACVGTNGGPYDYFAYSRGYFKAAHRLFDSIQENSSSIDLLVYPFVYLYRHGIELALKDLVLQLPLIWNEEPRQLFTHKLLEIWEVVHSYLIREPEFTSQESILATVDKLIQDFDRIDSSGEVFRFPEARNGIQFLQSTKFINLEVLGNSMKEVDSAFEYWHYRVQALIECRVRKSNDS